MNAARDIERAIRDLLSARKDLPVGVRVLAWQSPAETAGFDNPDAPAWSEDADRLFPVISVNATPPATEGDDSQRALVCDVAIVAGTKVADDRDRAKLRAMYELAEDFATALCIRQETGEELSYAAFEQTLDRYDPAILLGGVVRGSPQPPAESAGVYTLGTAIRVKFFIHPKKHEE